MLSKLMWCHRTSQRAARARPLSVKPQASGGASSTLFRGEQYCRREYRPDF
jgi:hypothetical protein